MTHLITTPNLPDPDSFYAKLAHAQRNKRGEYDKALSRVLLDKEFALLFEHQRRFGNPYASADFEARVRGDGD